MLRPKVLFAGRSVIVARRRIEKHGEVPSVSVIVPCYNGEHFLADALYSVRDQTLRDFECIIVDDASTDESRRVANRFVKADRRFRLISAKKQRGAAAARNEGIAKAKGRWIALLDADDLYLATRLERLTYIGSAEQADLVVDDHVLTEFPAMNSSRRAFGFQSTRSEFTQEDYFLGSRLFGRALSTGYMQPLMRREFLLSLQARYDPAVMSGEDFLLYAQLFANRPRCFATSFAGYVYRRRRGSVSHSDTYLHFHSGLGRRVLQEYGARLSPVSQAALEGRERDLRRLMEALPTLTAARRRDMASVAKSLAERPSAALTCLRLAQRKLLRTFLPLRAQASANEGESSRR